MNNKKLQILIIIVLLLGALFYFSDDDKSNVVARPQSLLANLSVKDISSVQITRGEDSVTIKQVSDGWVVAQSSDYPADRAKVNSLFLKLFDISTSQIIPSDESSLNVLGLTDESVKESTTRIRFLAGDGKELESVYLGQLRKTEADPIEGGGQFVRAGSSSGAYLVPQPIYVDISVQSWLDVNVVNILKSRVLSVESCEVSGCESSVDFELRRSGEESGQWRYSLNGSNNELDDVVVSQLISGLENFRLSGVYSSVDSAVSELDFNRRVTYKVENGLVYSVEIASLGDKNFAKIAVRFDEELANKLTTEANALEQAAEQSQASVETVSEATPALPSETTKPKMSNVEDAERTNSIYKHWVYEIENFQANKIKVSKEDLLKKISGD